MPKMRSVTHCIFIEEHNLFATALYDKSNKTSTLEISCFLKTGFIQDKFRLRSDREKIESKPFTADNTTPRVSILEAMKEKSPSFTAKAGLGTSRETAERASFTSFSSGFEFIPSEAADRVQKIVSVPFISKIKGITFCEQLDVLSIGL